MHSKTFTADDHINGRSFVCPRCSRVYAFPEPAGPPIRCECGWWYTMDANGVLKEEFKTRIGYGAD